MIKEILVFFVLLTNVRSIESASDLTCEATPIEYDHTMSILCQQSEIDRSIIDDMIELPDLTDALKNSSSPSGDTETQEAKNVTFVSVDPSNVTDLSIWAQFTDIPDHAFSKFPNLRQLHIAQFYENVSRVVKIGDHAFDGLSKLEWLGLHVNLSQQSIPKSIMNISSLRSLAFYEADLNTEFKIGNLPNLAHLAIYNSPNMSIAENAFDSVLDTLTEIDLSNVQIQKFPKSICELRHLSRLEIEGTELREIPPEAFKNSAESVRIVRLSRNKISVLHPTSFKGLKNLKVLQLAYNEIEEIPVSIFDDLISLEVLNLCGNKIRLLPAGIFDKTKNLRILDLDENPVNITGIDFLKGHVNEESESSEMEGETGVVTTPIMNTIGHGTTKASMTTTIGPKVPTGSSEKAPMTTVSGPQVTKVPVGSSEQITAQGNSVETTTAANDSDYDLFGGILSLFVEDAYDSMENTTEIEFTTQASISSQNQSTPGPLVTPPKAAPMKERPNHAAMIGVNSGLFGILLVLVIFKFNA